MLAVLLLFPFHTLRVFNDEPFYVKAGHSPRSLNAVLAFISVWHMPLLFVLAGASTFFALRKRAHGGILGERFTRLGVPFVMGVFFVLIPAQTWYGARFNSGYQDSFWHYLTSGDFLVWNIQDGGDYYGGFGFGHLWFIFVLLFVSAIALPLLASRGRGGALPAASRAASRIRPGGCVAAFADHARRGGARPDRRAAAVLLPRRSSCSATWSSASPTS